MPFRYVPLLRTKSGESTALEQLGVKAKARVFPLVHVVAAPPATFTKRVISAWSGNPLAVDGTYNYNLKGSAADLTSMLKALGTGGVKVVPCAEYGITQAYITSISPLIGKYGPGLVVKVSLGDLPSVLAWVIAQGWNTGDVDLVVNLGHVGAYEPSVLAAVVVQECNQHIGQNHPWRSVTLASAAAPKDFGGLPRGRTNVPRRDWQLWNASRGGVKFQLDYGDFGVGHPDLEEPPGVAMASATVSVRYTVDDYWIAIKGKQQGGKAGQPMHPQFLAHAKALVQDPAFGNLQPCWGDDQIRRIASAKLSPGSRSTWVEYSANRHLSLVADRLP